MNFLSSSLSPDLFFVHDAELSVALQTVPMLHVPLTTCRLYVHNAEQGAEESGY